ncbi:MAG: MSMEG_0568 family radical SAM protein [Polyangiaceae bacterium]
MPRALPIATSTAPTARPPAHWPELLSELQALGMRWDAAHAPGLHRKGGAGPSDHKAVTLAAHTVMVPIFTHASARSPFSAEPFDDGRSALLLRDGQRVAELSLPAQPRFYARSTADGVPYWKIATLHASDVLASTVLQTCIRYGNRDTSCQFCAIGKSLAAKATIPEKTPEQLAEVAAAAVELDGVKHAVLTTGTPQTSDCGAQVLSDCARAIKQRVALPIQAQCEPPDNFSWFERLRDAGVDSLGLHLEAVSERVRRRIMPGKAEVPISVYLEAFASSVAVFGRGQVSTYILAGLGDTRAEILAMCERLTRLGVYPFVVPFVPIAGTPLEHAAPPEPAFMRELLAELAGMLRREGLASNDIKAGCGRCGACSSLRVREAVHA